MTQQEIIEMARKAGAIKDGRLWLMYPEDLVTFAKLVAAKEREAALDLVDAYAKNNTDLADAIRARGE
jgi:hypothetical protein